MIKLICFDLDGVLVSSKELHFNALNLALSEIDDRFIISQEDHIKSFDGLPTIKKLDILNKTRGLKTESFNFVWTRKQDLTEKLIESDIKPNLEIKTLFQTLKNDGYKVVVCSNSIRSTTHKFLIALDLMDDVDKIYTTNDIKNPKPHPEIYMKAMLDFGVSPKETLIVEDSHVGVTAAIASCAEILVVKSPSDVNKETIYSKLGKSSNVATKKKWCGLEMNILIPMAGAGSRFANAGYTFPKPLIDVHGIPMIQKVVDNLNIDARYTYVVQQEHYDKYNLKYMLNLITPDCNIVTVDGLTEGAACTTLLAEKYIDNDTPLFIANSDQYIVWDSCEFMYSFISGNHDGTILTFKNTHPKWSYLKTDEDGYVTEIAEKMVISDMATTGHYGWRKGSDYVSYAKKMIERNIRVNNEFYVAPVYNLAIESGLKFKQYEVSEMYGLGTPEDLDYFLRVVDR